MAKQEPVFIIDSSHQHKTINVDLYPSRGANDRVGIHVREMATLFSLGEPEYAASVGATGLRPQCVAPQGAAGHDVHVPPRRESFRGGWEVGGWHQYLAERHY